MKKILSIAIIMLFATAMFSQGFPDAQKQPKMKEQRRQHRKFARSAKRKHVKRGTAYNLNQQGSPGVADDKQKRLTAA